MTSAPTPPGGGPPPPSGGSSGTPDPGGGSTGSGDKWGRIGAIATIVAIPIGIFVAVWQGGSHDGGMSSPATTTLQSGPALTDQAGIATKPSAASTPTAVSTSSPVVTATSPGIWSSGGGRLSTYPNSGGLQVRNSGDWTTYFGSTEDLWVTTAVLSPGEGASLAFFGDREPTYAECSQKSFAGALPWSKVPSGSYVCIKTGDGRVGFTRADYRIEKDGGIDYVQLTGLVWK